MGNFQVLMSDFKGKLVGKERSDANFMKSLFMPTSQTFSWLSLWEVYFWKGTRKIMDNKNSCLFPI